MVTNKIVQRGFGLVRNSVPGRAGIITLGYGGPPPPFIVSSLERPARLRLGQSGTKRRLAELDELIIWAKLIQVNDKPAPPPKVQGWIRVKVDKSKGYASVMAEHIASRSRAAWEVIKVTVSRLK